MIDERILLSRIGEARRRFISINGRDPSTSEELTFYNTEKDKLLEEIEKKRASAKKAYKQAKGI